MLFRKKNSDKWFIVVNWDFNDPPDMPVVFVDYEGNSCEGSVELDFDTWEAAKQ
jgi:hypothetical protein